MTLTESPFLEGQDKVDALRRCAELLREAATIACGCGYAGLTYDAERLARTAEDAANFTEYEMHNKEASDATPRS